MNNLAINSSLYTIGVGLTDRCNSHCPHCYSRSPIEPQDLNREHLLTLLTTLPVQSINFGTGESILYPHFIELLRDLAQFHIPLAVTTNGYTVERLSDEHLKLFHDIDFSIDFAQRDQNDQWRGSGSFEAVMRGAERCRKLGVEASLVTCLMKANCREMGALAKLAIKMGLSLRVNVYKPVFNTDYSPSYHEFWQAIADLADTAYFISCSEPIVKAALGYDQGIAGAPCGQQSFRIHPDGKVVSCVYLNHSQINLTDLIADFERCKSQLSEPLELPIPEICRNCPHLAICRGGCPARRILTNPQAPDPYCFIAHGEPPWIQARWKESKGLVHENYLCTMIFSA